MLYCYNHMKELLYEVRYLKLSEDIILALTGQFKQLSVSYTHLTLPTKLEV